MWKPSRVVPRHRNRAIVVWVAILLTALAYTVWQTTVVIRKRQNPSTKLLVSNQRYQFPLVTVCLEDGFGCGYADGSIEQCIGSALVVSLGWYGEFEELSFPSQGKEDNCIEFDLTQFEVPEGERETATGVTATIAMDWISSDNATAETEYSAGVFVYLSDGSSDDQGEEEYMMVPYSRNEVASNGRNFELTAMTIGKTNRKYLSGTSTTNYPVMTLSTTRVVSTKDVYSIFPVSSTASTSSYYSSTSSSWRATVDSAIGSLYLEITQGSYSHTQVEDIEPLEIGALFGNVGGFWELLVLAWGVFFITKSRDAEPTLKARNFVKVLQRGDSKKRKRRKLDSAAAEEAGHDGPRPPDWDASDDDVYASSASDSSANEKHERSRRHRTHRSARPRRSVAQPPSTRVSSHSLSSSLGTSGTTSNTLVLSRRSSASMAEGTGSAMPSTLASRRWSGSNAASAANKFHSFDAGVAQTRTAVFTVNGSNSSNNPNGGDGGRARTSFFNAPHAGAGRMQIHHHDSDGESSQSATSPAHRTSNSVENGGGADENNLELGDGGQSEDRHGQA